MQHNPQAFDGDNYNNPRLVRGPMMSVVPATGDDGKPLANLFQAAVYKMNRQGQRELARLSARRVPYGEAFSEAAKMAGVPGYA